MKFKNLSLLILTTLFLFGCSEKIVIQEVINNEAKESTEKSSEENNEYIVNLDFIDLASNSYHINNIENRNATISARYKESIDLLKSFSFDNNIVLTFIEPLEDRINRFEEGGKTNLSLLLKQLSLQGAESINYFTNEEGLNIDLSIYLNENQLTYDSIIYKSSIENISKDFKFKDSKLNEFRNLFLNDKSLDFDKVNNYIEMYFDKKLDSKEVFFNNIDDSFYEFILIENTTCYYKLIYDPKL